MSDQELLDRAELAARSVALPDDRFDDLLRRRDRKRRNRRIGTIVLALAVAAMGIGGIVEAIRRAESSTSPRPANLPSTPEAWSRLRRDPAPDGGLLAAGPGLVTVGAGERLAEVWTSSDGRTWSRVPGQQLGPGSIMDVTAGGPGLVAVGTNYNELANTGGSTGGPFHAVVWTSKDGLTWTRLPDDPVFQEALFATAVTAGGPGVVAVGAHNVAWFSSDGTTWEMAAPPPVPADVYPGDDGRHPQVYMTDVAASSDHLVAIGWAMLNDNSEVPVIWSSTDGTSWANVPLDPEVFPRGGDIAAVTSGPEGFVAIGSLGNERAAIWASADGEHWHLVSPGQEAVAGPLTLNSVTAGEGGYVAVGTGLGAPRFLCPSGNENCAYDEAAMLTSVDGKAWIRVPSAPVFRVDHPRDPERNKGAAMFTVAPWGSRYVSLGTYDNEPTVWISNLSLTP